MKYPLNTDWHGFCYAGRAPESEAVEPRAGADAGLCHGAEAVEPRAGAGAGAAGPAVAGAGAAGAGGGKNVYRNTGQATKAPAPAPAPALVACPVFL